MALGAIGSLFGAEGFIGVPAFVTGALAIGIVTTGVQQSLAFERRIDAARQDRETITSALAALRSRLETAVAATAPYDYVLSPVAPVAGAASHAFTSARVASACVDVVRCTDDAGTVDPVALRADTDTASGCPAVTTPSADGATAKVTVDASPVAAGAGAGAAASTGAGTASTTSAGEVDSR